MMKYREITIRVYDPEPLPESISAVSNKAEDGHYNIFLSSNRTELERAADLLHEFLHIWHDDHDSPDTERIELERREELAGILSALATAPEQVTNK